MSVIYKLKSHKMKVGLGGTTDKMSLCLENLKYMLEYFWIVFFFFFYTKGIVGTLYYQKTWDVVLLQKKEGSNTLKERMDISKTEKKEKEQKFRWKAAILGHWVDWKLIS